MGGRRTLLMRKVILVWKNGESRILGNIADALLDEPYLRVDDKVLDYPDVGAAISDKLGTLTQFGRQSKVGLMMLKQFTTLFEYTGQTKGDPESPPDCDGDGFEDLPVYLEV